MMNKLNSIVFALIMISCDNETQNHENKFHGSWQLRQFEYLDKEIGSWLPDTTRTGYKGLILYDGEGHMSVQITTGAYQKINGQFDLDALSYDSLKSIALLYATNYSYFANYSLSDSVIEHNVVSASDPGLCGKILKRHYEFDADTLYLAPVVSDSLMKFRLKWIKTI